MRRELLYKEVTQSIKDYIEEEGFVPGDRLPTEEELCETLSVSRTSMREAMKVLSGYGLLEIQQGRGIFVKDPAIVPSLSLLKLKCKSDENVVIELLDMRQVLEIGVIDFVIQNASQADLKNLKKSIERTEIIVKESPEKMGKEDLKFHIAYLHATNNRFIEEFGGTLREFFMSWEEIRPYTITSEIAGRALSEHKSIYKAIEEKDRDSLEQTLRAHLSRRNNLLESLEAGNNNG